MSDTEPETADEEIVVAVSDFLDGLRTEVWRAEIAARIAAEPAWQQVHAEMVETRKVAGTLSGLQKARLPATFAQDVTATIHKRSAGRFFARRTLGDRVPFGVLAIVALLAIAAMGYLMWASQTGSLAPSRDPEPAHHGSGALVAPP